MRVLVTGGAGYIGCRLVPYLVAAGHNVRVLDALFFGADGLATLVGSGAADLIVGDLRNEAVVRAALVDCDALVHLAAMSNDPSAELDANLTRSINRDATLRLFDAAVAAGIRRIVNASSATVYGVQEHSNVHEGCELRPITLYGRFKAETEAAALALNGKDVVVSSLRAATVCGMSGRPRLDLSVNMLTAHAVGHGRIQVFGGSQMRPNVHIDDVVRAYSLLLSAPPEVVGGRPFNVGFENISILDMAKRIRDVLDRDIQIEILPVHDERSYHVTSDRIQDELGFRPQRGIDDAIREIAAAVDDGILADLSDPQFLNVSRMQELLKSGSLVTQVHT